MTDNSWVLRTMRTAQAVNQAEGSLSPGFPLSLTLIVLKGVLKSTRNLINAKVGRDIENGPESTSSHDAMEYIPALAAAALAGHVLDSLEFFKHLKQ